MLPQHVVRYVAVAAAIYITSVYSLSHRPNDAFTLAGVAIGALFVADHYAQYSWMRHQLYGTYANMMGLQYQHMPHHAHMAPMNQQLPCNDPYAEMLHQQTTAQQSAEQCYTPPIIEVPQNGPRPAAHLYQYRNFM
jgi:hypothetical protein